MKAHAHQTSKQGKAFLRRFIRGTKGIDALSVGAYPHDACKACHGMGFDPATMVTVGEAASVMAYVLDDDADTCSDCNGKGTSCECGECEDFDPEIGDEGHFSWRDCEACGADKGGNRHAAHGLISLTPKGRGKRKHLIHLDVCTDCLFFVANGDLPHGDE
jgi:hypothetical protein